MFNVHLSHWARPEFPHDTHRDFCIPHRKANLGVRETLSSNLKRQGMR